MIRGPVRAGSCASPDPVDTGATYICSIQRFITWALVDSRRFGGRVPKCMEGPARHMQELPWSQPASGVLKEDVDAALDHEEELVRVPVYMG
jgi:hypothetical protein